MKSTILKNLKVGSLLLMSIALPLTGYADGSGDVGGVVPLKPGGKKTRNIPSEGETEIFCYYHNGTITVECSLDDMEGYIYVVHTESRSAYSDCFNYNNPGEVYIGTELGSYSILVCMTDGSTFEGNITI